MIRASRGVVAPLLGRRTQRREATPPARTQKSLLLLFGGAGTPAPGIDGPAMPVGGWPGGRWRISYGRLAAVSGRSSVETPPLAGVRAVLATLAAQTLDGKALIRREILRRAAGLVANIRIAGTSAAISTVVRETRSVRRSGSVVDAIVGTVEAQWFSPGEEEELVLLASGNMSWVLR